MKIKDPETVPLEERKSKVSVDDFASPVPASFYSNLDFEVFPDQLGGKTFKRIADSIVESRRSGDPVVLAMGAHPVKCGLSLILNQLIERDLITVLAVNGATVIHDFEILYAGKTSEDVEEALNKGIFGMARETGEMINRAVNKGTKNNKGFGDSVKKLFGNVNSDYGKYSLITKCNREDIPVTVHVAPGTDIIHQHPEADGASIGEGTFRDFDTLTRITGEALQGGTWINLGSAVLLPEIFLKAYARAVNSGVEPSNFTTVNMDMIDHYRPRENVVNRPESDGYILIGRHEINIPLLSAAVLKKDEEV